MRILRSKDAEKAVRSTGVVSRTRVRREDCAGVENDITRRLNKATAKSFTQCLGLVPRWAAFGKPVLEGPHGGCGSDRSVKKWATSTQSLVTPT